MLGTQQILRFKNYTSQHLKKKTQEVWLKKKKHSFCFYEALLPADIKYKYTQHIKFFFSTIPDCVFLFNLQV